MLVKKYFLCAMAVIFLFTCDSSFSEYNTTRIETEQLQSETSFLKSDSTAIPFVASFGALAILLTTWHLVNFVFGRCAEEPSKTE